MELPSVINIYWFAMNKQLHEEMEQKLTVDAKFPVLQNRENFLYSKFRSQRDSSSPYTLQLFIPLSGDSHNRL